MSASGCSALKVGRAKTDLVHVAAGGLLAVAMVVGVFSVMCLLPGPHAPREAVICVIDDSASPGPKVMGTAVAPMR